MRLSSLIPWAALTGVLASLALSVGFGEAWADGVSTRKDVIPVSEIKRGMKGYGLTVFEGTTPERFDVEVIDVLRNFRPNQELILVKTLHPRLDVVKVVAGMSGSPIFLNGKMAGAYAYGWTFGREPVAGVTPIRAMLDDLDRPLPKLLDGWRLDAPPPGVRAPTAALHGTSPGGPPGRFAGRIDRYDLREHARALATATSNGLGNEISLRPVATPLLVGGLTSSAVEVAKELLSPLGLEPLQAGGGGDQVEAGAPSRYVDGGAIGVQMISGDMSAMGLGTVTRVEGDRLVAFGHPMMEAGVTALPTAIGRVLWFLASDYRSFKIGMPVRPVGALVNDRQASIVVSHGAKAPTIPVTLDIKGVPGAPHTNWKFTVAHDKFMTPSFLSVALGSAVQAAANDRQDVTWAAKSRVKIKDHGEIVLDDFGVSVGGTPDSREFIGSDLVRAVGAVLNNAWEPARIESVHTDIELRYAREVLRLRGAEVLDAEVEAGGTARVKLTLLPYSGPPTTRIIEIPIPRHLAGQTLSLSVRPGHMVSKERPSPEGLADLIRNLVDPSLPPKAVVVSYPGSEAVLFKGHVAQNLPPGALDSIRPASATIAPEPYRAEVHQLTMLPSYLVGQDRVSVVVKPVLR